MSKAILFIDFLPMSGSCTGLLTEIKYLQKQYAGKYNCIVVGSKNSILDKQRNELNYIFYPLKAYEAVEFKSFPIPFLKTYFSILVKLIYICSIRRPRIIHCNHYMWSIYANPLGLLLNIPVVIHLKDVWVLKPKWARVLMKFNPKTRYIAVSNYVKSLFVSKYRLNKKHTCMIYDGIDTEIFFPPSKNSILNKTEEKVKKIIMVSRIAPERDIEVFIDAAAFTTQKYPQFKFLHYGYDPKYVDHKYYLALKQRVETLGLTKVFKFMPYESNPIKLAKIYRKAYLSIVPARRFALPNVVIESILSGTPVIASSIGGNNEIIARETIGKLLKSNSPLLFAQEIEQLVINKQLYLSQVIEGIKYVSRKFSARKQIQKVVALYDLMMTSAKF